MGKPKQKCPHLKIYLYFQFKKKRRDSILILSLLIFQFLRYQTHQLRNVSDDYCATVQCYRYDDKDDIQWNQFDFVKVKKLVNVI